MAAFCLRLIAYTAKAKAIKQWCSLRETNKPSSSSYLTSPAFDVIHRFILLFAWDMPEIGYVGTIVRYNQTAAVRIIRNTYYTYPSGV
jgi:hypothetical protein